MAPGVSHETPLNRSKVPYKGADSNGATRSTGQRPLTQGAETEADLRNTMILKVRNRARLCSFEPDVFEFPPSMISA